jgi:hypothetical protein
MGGKTKVSLTTKCRDEIELRLDLYPDMSVEDIVLEVVKKIAKYGRIHDFIKFKLLREYVEGY